MYQARRRCACASECMSMIEAVYVSGVWVGCPSDEDSYTLALKVAFDVDGVAVGSQVQQTWNDQDGLVCSENGVKAFDELIRLPVDLLHKDLVYGELILLSAVENFATQGGNLTALHHEVFSEVSANCPRTHFVSPFGKHLHVPATFARVSLPVPTKLRGGEGTPVPPSGTYRGRLKGHETSPTSPPPEGTWRISGLSTASPADPGR